MRIIKKKIDFNLSKEKFNYLLNFISEKEKRKILKYRKYEDSLRSLYGKIIIREALGLDIIELEYNNWGKPKLINNNNQFSISHSGEWVVVGIGASPLGVDIEKISDINLSIAKRYFHPKEREYIFSLGTNEQKDAFYKIWTLKEAYIKAKGMGLFIPLESFAIDISNKIPKLYNEQNEFCEFTINRIENYFIATCIF